MRKRKDASETLAATPVQPTYPHEIRERSLYFLADLERYARLKPSAVRREHRMGRLRIGKRCGRIFVLGNWLIEWLAAGELKRRSRPEITHGNGRWEAQ